MQVRAVSAMAFLLALVGPHAMRAAQQQQVGPITITITIVSPLQVTTTALSQGQINQPYTAKLTATGGVPPYVWSIASGSAMPPGLALSSDGTVTGTPTQGGNFSFSIMVKDSAATNSPAAVPATK